MTDMFNGASNGEGQTGAMRAAAFFGYAMGSMENAIGFAVPGIAELFAMYALNEYDTTGAVAKDSWNKFIAIPRVNYYINQAVSAYGGIR